MELEYQRESEERIEEVILEIMMAQNSLKLIKDVVQETINTTDPVLQGACLKSWPMAGVWEFGF